MIKKINFNSIRNKLILSLISICIIPLIILGISSYEQSKKILNNKLNITSNQTLSEINSGLDDYFLGFEEKVTMMANNYNVVNVDFEDNFDYVSDLLKNLQESNEDILDSYYGSNSGKFSIYPNTTMSDDYDARNRPWYEEGTKGEGKAVITKPYVDVVTGNIVVGIVQAVVKDNEIVGVIGIDCSLSTLAERIATKKIGNSGSVFITDSDGIMLAHRDKDLINTDTATHLSYWDEIKSNQKGFVTYDYNGKNKFGAYQTNDLTGWKLIASLEQSEITDDTKYILLTISVIILIMFFISIIMSLLLSRELDLNIKKLKEVFAKASNGDLSAVVDVKSKDELGKLGEDYNSMIKHVGRLLESAKHTSNTVLYNTSNLLSMSEETTASMSQVSLAVSEISQGAVNLAENSQETVEGVEELSKKLDDISDVTKEMSNVSNNTKDLSKEGIEIVNTLINKNNKTMESTLKVSHIVTNMNDSVKKISAISDVINEITEQTNLLSLNASIEAARAGESGKGFAVVAEEIRKLAEESRKSTEEIKTIIEEIQEKAREAVQAMNGTKKINSEQDESVTKTEKIFNDILFSITTLTEKVGQVSYSVENMNHQKQIFVTQIENTSAIAEETSSATEEVNASAEEVTATMDKFNLSAEELQHLAEKLKIEIDKFKV